ncbi:hypothetical protein THRCLA_02708 [Thraustotheca clavata]|uniref:Uncharacterized protein n=1 Tax=Thraustotheca clavata TaxID=74557 RepID=A0A1W0A4A1_9STRA|nr:hypothetical protein THRCLA_02708 [Thraustotheca clavata]
MPFRAAIASEIDSKRMECDLTKCSRAPVKAPPAATNITALIAKIRKQAKELSELHEELAAKDNQIEKLKSAKLSGQVVVQGERQRIKSLEAQVHEWKLKYEKEHKKHEACIKRLREVKISNQEASKSSLSKEAETPESEDEGKSDEQRNYISVLEDALKLKAQECNIGGQAELLLVLAELRQKISALQETVLLKDVKISELEKRVHEANVETQLCSSAKQSDAVMDYAQSLSDKQKSFENQIAELTHRLEQSELDCAASKHELRNVADQYNSLLHDYDHREAEFAKVKAKLEKFEQESSKHLNDASQLHELKQLQEDLLSSISDSKANELKYKQKLEETRKLLDAAELSIEQLERDAQRFGETRSFLEKEIANLQSELATLRQSHQTIQNAKAALQSELDTIREHEAAYGDMAACRKSFSALTESERRLRSDMQMIDHFVATIHTSIYQPAKSNNGTAADGKGTFIEWFTVGDLVARVAVLESRRHPPQLTNNLPKLASYLHEIYSSVMNVVQHISQMEASWTREKFNLVAARDAFDASANLIQNELNMMHTWNNQLQEECQQKHRQCIELDQRVAICEANMTETTHVYEELKQKYDTTQQTLFELKFEYDKLLSTKQTQMIDEHDLREQIEELEYKAEEQKRELETLKQDFEETCQALKHLQKHCSIIQEELKETSTSRDLLTSSLEQLQNQSSSQSSLLDQATQAQIELQDQVHYLDKRLEEKSSQLDTIKAHMNQLQNLIWDVYVYIKPLLPDVLKTSIKPKDPAQIVSELPSWVDAIIEKHVENATKHTAKQSLLANCSSVEYAEPSLCLVRELKRDLQQTQNENQTLKIQLSDARVHSWQKNTTPPPRSIDTGRRAIAQGLRNKLARSPKHSKDTPIDSYAMAEAYVVETKSSSLDEQLDRLRSAFASFGTEV